MPLIIQFPGPNAALLWYFFRCYRLPLLVGCAGGGLVGMVVAAYAASNSIPQNLYVLVIPWIVILAAMHRRGREPDTVGLFQRLPIATRDFVCVEFVSFVVGFALVAACYIAGRGVPAEDLVRAIITPLVLLAAIGALIQTWYWVLRLPETADPIPWYLTPYLLILILCASFYPSIESYGSPPAGPGFWSACAIIAALGLAVSLRLARRTRCGDPGPYDFPGDMRSKLHADRPSPEQASIQRGELDLSDDGAHPQPSIGADLGQPPFPSRIAAQSWYESRLFLESARRPPLVWIMGLGMLFLFPLGTFQQIPGPTKAADVLCATAGVIWMMWFSHSRSGMDFQRPLSNWQWSVAVMRIAAVSLLALGLVCAAIIQSDIRMGDIGSAHPGAIHALALAVWSGWIALALYPGVLGAYCLLTLFGDAPPEFTASIFCLLWAGAQLIPGKEDCEGGPIHGVLVVAVTAAVFTGFVYLPDYTGPPWIAWIAREVLGAAFVLLVLQRCRWGAHLPASTARKVRRALLAGVVLSCLAASALQPDGIAVSGIAGGFLAFGLVPPIFLPLLIMPIQIASMRSKAEKHIRARRGQR
ncbi:MAG: hypothetical protein KF886_02045 [Candidatus Hydrogenedentes bacterium]|nr:hypothetical protein [Candidatus Hydrogenedentota bacterium]